MPRIGRLALVCGQLDATDATVYTENLVRGLNASGVIMRAVGPGGPLARRLKEAGVELTPFPLMGKSIVGGIGSVRAAQNVYSFLPDLIHATTPEAYSAAKKAAVNARVPLVVTVHEFIDGAADLPWKPGDAPLAIVPSEALRENLVNDGQMPKGHVIVVPYGLDLSIYPPRPPERPPSGSSEWGRGLNQERTTTIGCMSPLIEGKGIELFIRAAKLVLDAGKDAEFFIAGSGPKEEQFRALAHDVGSRGRATFLGSDIRPEQLMKNLDVFVSASRREALGMSLLQAMACSRPVIAAAAGGTFGVVNDGETGFLVPPGDERALADRMTQLTADARMRSEMGRAGREKLEEEFSLDQMIKQTEAAYARALEEPQLK